MLAHFFVNNILLKINLFFSQGHDVNSNQRNIQLQLAHSQSFGYFVTQDSSFGNYILPVLPRFDTKETK